MCPTAAARTPAPRGSSERSGRAWPVYEGLATISFETVGIWIEIPEAVKEIVAESGLHFMGGIHALEHAAIAMFPLFALCDRDDIGGISTTELPVGKQHTGISADR